jgi:ligand-binding sensor domain-containing protein
MGDYPLVLHGASSVPKDLVDEINKYGGKDGPDTAGVPEADIEVARRVGCTKVNIDTDLRMAMTAAIRKVFAENPKEFDPRKYLGPARRPSRTSSGTRSKTCSAAPVTRLIISLGRGGQKERLVSACEDADGAVWLYTADAHLARYQNGEMEILDFNFKSPAVCRMLIAEKSGPLWIGEDWGMFSFRPANFKPPAFAVEQLIRARRLDYLLASQTGGTWRLMDGQVQKWGSTQAEKNWGPYPWGNAKIKDACEDQEGNLIVGTLGAGVFWYEADGKYRQISTAQGLSSPYVLSLCVDSQGNLWVGTDGGGLDRIKRKLFNSPAGLPPRNVQSLSEDARAGLWVAFGAQGAAYWETNSVQDFHVGPLQDAWAVLVDHHQRVWVGTWDEGLFRLETNQFQPVPDTEILGLQISVLFEDQGGQLWVGTPNGLGCWNGKTWKTYTRHDGEPRMGA